MRILGKEDLALAEDEYGTIHIFKGKRDHHYNPSSMMGKKIQDTLIILDVILEGIEMYYGNPWGFLRRCEYPALTRIIRTLMFEDTMSYGTARKYGWVLKKLAQYSAR